MVIAGGKKREFVLIVAICGKRERQCCADTVANCQINTEQQPLRLSSWKFSHGGSKSANRVCFNRQIMTIVNGEYRQNSPSSSTSFCTLLVGILVVESVPVPNLCLQLEVCDGHFGIIKAPSSNLAFHAFIYVSTVDMNIQIQKTPLQFAGTLRAERLQISKLPMTPPVSRCLRRSACVK